MWMKNNNTTLITAPLDIFFPTKKSKLIFLGDWIDRKVKDKHKIKINNKTIKSPWIDLRKRQNDFFYLTKRFEKISSILYSSLNTIHNTSFSKKYWEQVYGIWLIEFLISVYERYLIVKKIDNSKNISILTVNNENYRAPKNSREAKQFFMSDYWSHSIFIDLIKEFKKKINIKIIVDRRFDGGSIFKFKKEKFNLKSFIIKLFSKISSFIHAKNEIFIITTYLPFFKELLLQIKLNKIPKINLPLDNNYNFKNKLNQDLRNFKIRNNTKDDDFTKFIKNIIMHNIPLSFLEEFKEIRKLNKRLNWKKNPKKIFTSSSNFYDDIFKIWLAEKKENGCKLFLGQHGSQFINKFCTVDFYAQKTSDKILTWGNHVGIGGKFRPIGNLKAINKKVKIKKKQFISIIQDMPTKYNVRLWPGLDMCNYEHYIDCQNIFLKKLNKKVYSDIKIRLGSNLRHNSANNLLKFERKTWLKIHPDLKYESRDKNIYSTLENSYLTILTNVTSTLLLECLSFNIPFLILNPNYKDILSTRTLRDFKKLEKNNILYSSPKKLSNFLNTNNFNQITKWWYSEKNQQLVKEFQNNYASVNIEPIEELTKILSQKKKEL